MDIELRNHYEPIVRQYRLDTQHMEEHGNVMKIYTNQSICTQENRRQKVRAE